MNHYHVSFVDSDGSFYSASVETPHDLFTTVGIDGIAQELGERLEQEEPVAIINVIPLKS
ncbi:MAG: hypothetical protein ACYC2R_09130 [Burkholderiales bacterium]|nr:hypothetical protein [Sulfuricellaceae bacterium]